MRPFVRRSYLVASVVIAVATSVAVVPRAFYGPVADDPVLQLYNFVMAILVVTWLVTDPALPPSERPTIDHGFLLWTTFPFLAAYHQFIIRRWIGLLLVLGLVILSLLPYLTLIFVAGVYS